MADRAECVSDVYGSHGGCAMEDSALAKLAFGPRSSDQ